MPTHDQRSRARLLPVVIAGLVGFTLAARRLGYNLGGNVVVRCRKGHLFTTIWIPGVNLKAIDLGIARVQYCPIGSHWSMVLPVRNGVLTDEQRQTAGHHHDVRIP